MKKLLQMGIFCPPPNGVLPMMTLLYLLLGSLHVASGQMLQAQLTLLQAGQQVNISAEEKTLREVLTDIESQTGYIFVYSNDQVQTDRKISIVANKQDLNTFLARIFKPLNINYSFYNNQIVLYAEKTLDNLEKLKPKSEGIHSTGTSTNFNVGLIHGLSSMSLPSILLDKTITGKVTDATDGSGLPGVNVLAKGTTQGTITDVNGFYRLTVADNVETLVFSYVGYVTEEVAINNQNVVNLDLSPDIQSLSEIVVIGYGTQEKRDLTGAVSSIDEEKIKDMPLTTIDQGLQGLAAGVSVQQQTGQPGGATSIRIRGGNSINAGNEPLYVIDGFPIYNENSSSTTGVLSGVPAENALATINPNDIVSIEILKDASATAIYGSRAANGVILITTKRGKKGQSNVDFDMYYGIQEAVNKYDLMNAYEYAEFRNEQYIANGQATTYTDEQLEEFKHTGGTDWQEELLRTAPVQNYQVSISGGNENVQYMFSGNYFDQQGTMINSYLKRVSSRANIDVTANERLKFGLNFSAGHTWSNQLPTGGGRNGRTGVQLPNGGGIYQAALFFNPAIPVYDENGEYTLNNSATGGEVPGANQSNVPYGNPVAYANLAQNINFATRILGNMFGEWELMKGLKLKVTGGANMLFTKQNQYEPSSIFVGSQAPNGRAEIGSIQNIEWLNENILSYDRDLGQNHHINVLGGFTAQAFKGESFNGSSVDFTNDVLGYDNIQGGNASGERPPGIFSGADEWQLMSGIFRAFYSLSDRYLFTVTGRYDGSSRFGANNKWAFFPSAAFAWRVSDEPFMASATAISNLKLRLSWGQSGNQNIPTFRSLSALGTGGYTIGDGVQTGFFPTRIGNPDLKWETTTQTDIGIDLGLFQNRLELTADAYYKKTTDLLFDVPIALESGFASAFKNVGSLENKGVELALNASILTGELKWNASINWALNRNKILELQGEDEIKIDPNLNLLKAQNALLLKVGEPIGNFYGYQNDGIWLSQEQINGSGITQTVRPGQRRFVDQNDDGIINNDDRVVIGNALPDWLGGISNTFRWRNIELNFLFDFSYGNEVANLTQIEFEFLNGRQNGNKEVVKRWRADDPSLPRTEWTNTTNPDTDVQAVGGSDIRELHSRYVEDGSFIRLRNLTLAYNLPVQNLGFNWMRRLRIYFSGQNLLLFTQYSGLDPEANIFANDNTRLGLDYAVYPSSRIYTFGINLGF